MTSAHVWPQRRYAWYVVSLLTLAYALAILDRVSISLLIEPLQADLHINDTEFGLLQGLAFSLFYSVLGLPLGILVGIIIGPIAVGFEAFVSFLQAYIFAILTAVYLAGAVEPEH